MTRFAMATALLALLAACDDDQPLDFNGGGQTPTTPTPTDEEDPLNPDELPPVNGVFGPVAGALNAATFNATAETLTVQIALDVDTVSQTYTRNAAYDRDGYIAFTAQDDQLDRFFTGLAAESANGDSIAVLAMDGGQFNTYFGGVSYSNNDLTIPTSGLVSYAGSYVGLSNVGTRDGTLPSAGDSDILPRRATGVSGDIIFNADFTDNQINGAIYNRASLDGSGVAVDTVFLIPTAIASDGTFTGAAQNRGQDNIGVYSGGFGGTNASSLAGGVYLTNPDPSLSTEEERGIFVLNQCGTAGDASICDTLDLDDLGE